MKITNIVAVLHKAAMDMQAFAARNDDFDLPDQVVLPFIMNFLTDERLPCAKCSLLQPPT